MSVLRNSDRLFPDYAKTDEDNRAGAVAGEAKAVNDKGEPLLCASALVPGELWTAELRLPYTVVPGRRNGSTEWITDGIASHSMVRRRSSSIF